MPKFTTDEQLDNWFGYHKPSSVLVANAHDTVRREFRTLAQVLSDLLPEGADKTVALRSLREAMYHANACIAVAQKIYDPGE